MADFQRTSSYAGMRLPRTSCARPTSPPSSTATSDARTPSRLPTSTIRSGWPQFCQKKVINSLRSVTMAVNLARSSFTYMTLLAQIMGSGSYFLHYLGSIEFWSVTNIVSRFISRHNRHGGAAGGAAARYRRGHGNYTWWNWRSLRIQDENVRQKITLFHSTSSNSFIYQPKDYRRRQWRQKFAQGRTEATSGTKHANIWWIKVDLDVISDSPKNKDG